MTRPLAISLFSLIAAGPPAVRQKRLRADYAVYISQVRHSPHLLQEAQAKRDRKNLKRLQGAHQPVNSTATPRT